MMNNMRHWIHTTGWAIAFLSLSSTSAMAQITPDATLGVEGSRLIRNVEVRGSLGDVIEGGAIRGSALFHSFDDFNVNEGQRVYFANPDAIQAILSRVTGRNISNIRGTLGVDGTADLFLLNPNGIIFGENAQLDVRGSFVATTADRFTFPDGSQFSSVDPQAPPLLTVNTPIGLQYGAAPGSIRNEGTLAVDQGQSLVLAGGQIEFDGGSIFALDGRAELIAVGSAGTIQLNEGDRSSIPDTLSRTDISLTNNSQVNTRATGSGNVIVTARNLSLLNNSAFRTGILEGLEGTTVEDGDIVIDATGLIDLQNDGGIFNVAESMATGNTGDILINAESLVLTEDSSIRTGLSPRAQGTVGDVIINVTGDVSLQDSFIGANNFLGDGDAGTIAITSDSLSAENNSLIFASITIDADADLGRGNAGVVQIDTNALRLADGSSISAFAGKLGIAELTEPRNAGHVTIQADTIRIENQSDILTFSSRGNGGDINIQANQLTLDNSSLFSPSLRDGRSGNISVDVTGPVDLIGGEITSVALNDSQGGDITISGDRLIITDTGVVDSSGLGTEAAGDIAINANQVSLQGGGRILAQTDGAGQGGEITIQATDFIEVIGTGVITPPDGIDFLFDTPTPSLISAGTLGDGAAGDISIDTGRLLLQDGGTIGADSLDSTTTGRSGNIIVNASESVEVIGTSNFLPGFEGFGDLGFDEGLLFSSRLSTNTSNAENAGDITINTQRLAVREGGQISTSTSGLGRGGRIEINAAESVEISGTTEELNNTDEFGRTVITPIPSFVRVDTSGAGNAGELVLNTGRLSIRDGGEIVASTTGEGQGGILTINASESVDVIGSRLLSNGERITSRIESRTTAEGNAGELNITTDRLAVQELGLISANTSGAGNAGTLRIDASGEVNIAGQFQEGETDFRSQVIINVEPRASGQGGQLVLHAGSLSISDGGGLNANTFGRGNAGTIDIRVNESINLFDGGFIQTLVAPGGVGSAGDISLEGRSLTLRSGSQIAATIEEPTSDLPGGQGRGGDIRLTIEDTIDIIGVSSGGASSGIFTNTEAGAQGRGGNIIVDTANLRLANGGVLSARTANPSRGGDITITAETLSLRGGAQILTTTTNQGNAGTITLDVADEIDLSGQDDTFAERSEDFEPGATAPSSANSGLFANTSPQSTGTAGNIRATTNRLRIADNAAIAVSSQGMGNAGDVLIQSRTAELENQGSITAETVSSVGGNIRLQELDSLELNNSLISASTQTGQGGSIEIDAENLSLRDRSEISVAAQPTNLTPDTQTTQRAIASSSPTAGDLLIRADQVNVDDSLISVSSPQGRAGSLSIRANQLLLNQGELSAIAGESDDQASALIQIEDLDLLLLRNESLISAEALNDANGGSIFIDAPNGVIVGVADENSDIVANADRGNGGNIDITTLGIYGLEFRNARSPFSDITASSQFGLDGTVIIETPDVDPSRGTVELPDDVVDASQRVAQTCSARNSLNADTGTFVVTGQGGLPPSPDDILDQPEPSAHWVTHSSTVSGSQSPSDTGRSEVNTEPITPIELPLSLATLDHHHSAQTSSHSTNVNPSITEAQGWVVNDRGTVMLVAEASTPSDYAPMPDGTTCDRN
jgi:filamentous hemagglutinin family protein